MGHDIQLVGQAVDAARAASSLDHVLEELVRHLRPRFDLWHATLSLHQTGAPEVNVLAAWSLTDSVFDAGAAVSATISRTVIDLLETLRAGHAATFTVGADPESLVDQLLREQGVASILALPIHCDERALLLLTLGAGSERAFQDAEKGFFTALSLGISGTVLRFASASNE